MVGPSPAWAWDVADEAAPADVVAETAPDDFESAADMMGTAVVAYGGGETPGGQSPQSP